MKSHCIIFVFLLFSLNLTAQDEIKLLAGYSYHGKISSVTDQKVTIRQANNKYAGVYKSEIWKIVYEDGREVVFNESLEEIESRIEAIDDPETLEQLILTGSDREAEIAYYYIIKKGLRYEQRDQLLSDFSGRFPNSKYRRELESMSRFNKKLKESKDIPFPCKSAFIPEVKERQTGFNLEFSDQFNRSHELDIEVNLKFIRTYGKKSTLKSADEWKNEYEISFILDNSSDPLVFKDTYNLVDANGDRPHKIFLNNVLIGKLNLNGEMGIRTIIREEDGEYTVEVDIQIDYQNWYD